MKSKAYAKALAVMRRSNAPDRALPLLLEAVGDGDVRADYALGTWYLHGFHLVPSVRKAVKHFRRAADGGHAGATFELALCFENGEGTALNPAKAASLYLRAYRLGHERAAPALWRMFYWGIGVAKNRDLADEFRRLSEVKKR